VQCGAMGSSAQNEPQSPKIRAGAVLPCFIRDRFPVQRVAV
jgi:hypothetical protein